MNQESLSFTLTQISYLVSNLNKKNFVQSKQQISQVKNKSGKKLKKFVPILKIKDGRRV